MAFVLPKKNVIESLAGVPGSEFEGNQFALESTGEIFTRSGDMWLGELRTDSITVDPVIKGLGVAMATVDSSDAIGSYFFEYPESQYLEKVHVTSVDGDQQITASVTGPNVKFIKGQSIATEDQSLELEAYDVTDPDNAVAFEGGGARPLEIRASSESGGELQFVVQYRNMLAAPIQMVSEPAPDPQ